MKDIKYDNTAYIKALAENIYLCEHEFPLGHESYCFAINQVVTSTGKGRLKPGVSVKITDRRELNGYCQYFGNGVWHQQNDLTT